MKTKRVIFAAALATIMFAGFKITSAQEQFYKHYRGKVGDNIQVIADIIRINDKLSGYYYYFFPESENNQTWTHYGKSLAIDGKVGPGNTIEFSEFGNEKGSIFRGTLENEMITGTWEGNDDKSLPFEMKEEYPPGTMAFRVYYLKDKTRLVSNEPDAEASIELILLHPANYSIQGVADSVSRHIEEYFFNSSADESDPVKMLEKEKDIYFRNYKSTNEEIYQEGSTSFNWQKIERAAILHNENSLLSIQFYDYGYTGGAHGFGVSKFKVFDLNTGKPYTLDDIFRPDYINDLRDIINYQVRADYNLSSYENLTAAGFFYETIDPSPNFYVTKEGIGFYYNQYEVTPYAMGPIDVFVPFSKLKRIMNQNCYIYKLAELN